MFEGENTYEIIMIFSVDQWLELERERKSKELGGQSSDNLQHGHSVDKLGYVHSFDKQNVDTLQTGHSVDKRRDRNSGDKIKSGCRCSDLLELFYRLPPIC